MISRERGSKRAGRLVLMVLGILVQRAAGRPAEFVTPGEMLRKSGDSSLISTRNEVTASRFGLES